MGLSYSRLSKHKTGCFKRQLPSVCFRVPRNQNNVLIRRGGLKDTKKVAGQCCRPFQVRKAEFEMLSYSMCIPLVVNSNFMKTVDINISVLRRSYFSGGISFTWGLGEVFPIFGNGDAAFTREVCMT